jgi:hypothetical protein
MRYGPEPIDKRHAFCAIPLRRRLAQNEELMHQPRREIEEDGGGNSGDDHKR